MKLQIKNQKDWPSAVADFCRGLEGHEILLLRGDLGAGKTTFVHALIQNLFREESPAASPTFALHHQYESSGGQKVDHWDLYRIQTLDELDAAGFWELLAAGDSLFVVEWPERVPVADWPPGRQRYDISIAVEPDGQRTLMVEKI